MLENCSHALMNQPSKYRILLAYRDHQTTRPSSIPKCYLQKNCKSFNLGDSRKLIIVMHCYNCRENKTDYVIDHFKTTEPLSTFAFGFIISQLTKVNATPTALTKPKINVWARKDLHGDLTVSFLNVEGGLEKAIE